MQRQGHERSDGGAALASSLVPDPSSVPAAVPCPLDEARTLVANVEGWLTDDQIARLHAAASAAPAGGRIVEIGSFRGRSTIVLASAASAGTEVVAIDPHAGNDRGPREIEGYEAEAATDNEVFEANLRAAGVRDRVVHHRRFSDDAHGEVGDPIDVLFIDGAHRFAPARADIRDWGARVAPGGRMLIHDSFSSVGVTLAILAELVLSDRWRYDGRAGSLAEYRRTRLTPPARARSAVAQLAQLGWFVRNVAIKALIVVGLGRFTRFVGHRQATWPY
jgi:predicted O-methyltransferase YrrM